MKHRYGIFYFFAFLLAAALRFIQLGALPLTDKEAALALNALAVAQGSKPLLGGQPGYILLTSIPFYLFESSNFFARFIPALSGSLIVFAPSLFRRKLGERVSLLLAFLLALAPGLVAVSRQATGTALAVTFGAFAVGLWLNDKPRLAGIFGGIALLGGSAAWMGLVSLAATSFLAQKLLPAPPHENAGASPKQVRFSQEEKRKTAAIFLGGTLLLVGTRFFLSPNGISAWLASLTDYLGGWATASGVSLGRIFGGLIAYYPLALFFAAIAKWRAIQEKKRENLLLSMWAVVSFLLVLLYPARQLSDLIWTALPLWVLSAQEIVRYLRPPTEDRNETLGVFALTLILLAFAWLNLASAGRLPENIQLTTQHQILLAGSVLLLILSLTLIAFGWSTEVAALGGAWGLLVGLGLYTLGSAWGAGGLRTPKGVELWDSAPRVAQAELLHQTVSDISTWSRGDANSLSVTVSGVHSPALLWILRDYKVNEVAALDITTAPELVITPLTEDVGLASAYRGQDFTWRQEPAWDLMSSWAKWAVLREVPLNSEQIILWARNDLFFDSQNQ
jgi:hypothetical protein